MKNRLTTCCLLVMLLSVPALALDLTITTETKDCNGKTGFTSFRSSHIQKIQTSDCSDPDDPANKLQQVFITSPLFPGSFDVVWVTTEGAELIKRQVKEGRVIEIERYQQPQIRVEVSNKTAVPVQGTKRQSDLPAATIVATEKTKHTAKPENAAKPELSIRILDPDVTLTRSATQIMASSDIDQRSVVGKVNSSAKLVSLTVNGESVSFEQSGVFKVDVPLNTTTTPVEVVAIDIDGNRAGLEFSFVQRKTDKQTKNSGFGNYKALIIANTEYQYLDKLVTPANDAASLQKVLSEDYSFETEVLENASRYDLLTRLNELRGSLTGNDNLLIYYAGHGTLDKANNRGHWLPVDAEPTSSANWVSASQITDIINSMSAKHVLLVADSCYSGALTRSSETKLDPGMTSDDKLNWYHTMSESRSRQILTSGGESPVLDDGGDGHSIFARIFIDILSGNTDILESSVIFEKLKTKVSDRATAIGLEQVPMFSVLPDANHEFGEFLFVAAEKRASEK